VSRPSPVLAVDLGGTHLRVATFNGERLGAVTTVAHGASGTNPLALASVTGWLRDALADAPAAALGVSVAGTVDRASGVVLVADNLGWSNLPLGPVLAAELGVPVRIDTDTFCGARAEARFGEAGAEIVLSIAIGTGIGHAWLANGEVWRGAQDAANLFGHLVIDPDGPPCYCGRRGCLCQHAAGPVIREAIERGDQGALDRGTDSLALTIAQALTLVNPDEVVLGGGAVSDAWPDLDDLSRRVTNLVHPEVRPIRIRRSTLGGEANLLGAGLLTEQAATRGMAVCGVGPHPQPFSRRGREKGASWKRDC
jgi:glucokinase